MSNDLIPRQEDFNILEKLSTYAVDSKFFGAIGGKGAILSIMLYAKELGLPPMQCLFGGMHNINGKIELSAALMNSMIRKAGHKLLIKSSNTSCTITGTRADTGEVLTVSFNLEDAGRAELKSPVWKKYPANMLFSRAIKNLARMLFSDVIGTAFVEGEAEEIELEKKNSKQVKETIPIEAQEDVVISEEPKEDITPEKAAAILSQILKLENDESLLEYVKYCQAKLKKSFTEMTNSYCTNAESIINHYVQWRQKQAPRDIIGETVQTVSA